MLLMIVLLSGEKKYSVEGSALDEVNLMGRAIYESLERNDIANIGSQLQALHSHVKENGIRADPYRNADLVVPPVNCDVNVLRELFNLQKVP